MNAKIGRNDPCPCGSGRKYKHCCGRVTAPVAPVRDANALVMRAAECLQRGDHGGAQRWLREAIAADARQPHAHYLLGIATRETDGAMQALPHFERAFELGLDDAPAHFQFARLNLELRRPHDAERCYRRALELKPDFNEAYRDLGNVCYETSRYAEAETLYRRALELGSNDWIIWNNLVHAVARQDRLNEASSLLLDAAERFPDSAEPYALRASLFELDNQVDNALADAQHALSIDPDSDTATLVLAKLARRRGDLKSALAFAEKLPKDAEDPVRNSNAFAEYGRVLDDLGRYEEALAAFIRAAALQHQAHGADHDEAAVDAKLTRIERWFADHADDLDSWALEDVAEGPQPIFVLSFPRSATTLVERILGAHDEIVPLGELPGMPAEERAIDEALDDDFPGGLDALDHGRRRDLLEAGRARYLERVHALIPTDETPRFFVDKAPLNSTHLGLLRLMFPTAPVIQTIRHPLDVVLSCLFVNFVDPHLWSTSLDTVAGYFIRVHDHLDRMAVYFPDRLHRIRYESLVEAPEPSVRAMLDFIGVDWQEACLRFHETARGVRTASYEQVTRPLYDSSVARFRHYLPYLDTTLLDTLLPTIERLGYAPEMDAADTLR